MQFLRKFLQGDIMRVLRDIHLPSIRGRSRLGVGSSHPGSKVQGCDYTGKCAMISGLIRPFRKFPRRWLPMAFLFTAAIVIGGCKSVQATELSSGDRLIPGKQYYFAENPVHGYFLSQTYTTKPLAAEKAETEEYIRIGVVRTDQKIDHDTTYLRKRGSFAVDPGKFKAVPDGTHFFLTGDHFVLEPVDIDHAVASEHYIKLEKQGARVTAEEVTTPTMSVTHYTYYPNGYFKKKHWLQA